MTSVYLKVVPTGLLVFISGIYYHKVVPLELKYKFAYFIINAFLNVLATIIKKIVLIVLNLKPFKPIKLLEQLSSFT